MYVNTGVSTLFKSAQTDTLLGGHLFTSWGKNEDYEIVEDTSLASWHNAAAEIAMETNPERPQVPINQFIMSFLSYAFLSPHGEITSTNTCTTWPRSGCVIQEPHSVLTWVSGT